MLCVFFCQVFNIFPSLSKQTQKKIFFFFFATNICHSIYSITYSRYSSFFFNNFLSPVNASDIRRWQGGSRKFSSTTLLLLLAAKCISGHCLYPNITISTFRHKNFSPTYLSSYITLFVRNTFLSPLNYHGTFVKDQLISNE